ncbi:hypothetical protein CONCODRAFT_5690 [Conidiobolus coronatus NRRL 28638]|uniref:Sequence orphan n=1 Tax=Conidiobolus coronatus (strain ATCC 28846 / CBS 209.66 / NRRL 28638) TaxID=796925 RepID=A0A137P9C9_CONC2|nr:hypothetical protein CONCODRAFT_5690 [Conidiobolus coronatus NRRL 28638]|eukprot:KXN71616.1 hypothetical protein CONCODRAFT_5690 [Conidiobolus coronatus NRRL 28638]
MLINYYFVGLVLSLVNAQCFDSPSILSGSHGLRQVNCSDPLTSIKALNLGLDDGKDARSQMPQQGKSKDGMIEVDLLCTSDENTCKMVMDTFVTASDYLTNIIKFVNPIKIQAKFVSFCLTANDCDKVMQTLGKAQSTRYHKLRGDDGKVRLYPQALAKQLNSAAIKHQFDTSGDILAEFNSDASFYFKSQGGQISRTQSDFLLVISHELLHGLGFATIYNDYLHERAVQALYPVPELLSEVGTTKVRINNFLESIFDRYIVFSNSKKTLTSITTKINGYGRDNKDKLFRNQKEAAMDFIKSDQYKVAKSLLKTAQTEGSMEFVFNTTSNVPYKSLVLETSIRPYTPASSVSHVAMKNYQNTKEFLMRPAMTPGNSLASLIAANAGSGKWDTAPYGPGIIAMLETIGYPTNQNPHPNVITEPLSDDTIIDPESDADFDTDIDTGSSSSSSSGTKSKSGSFGYKSTKISWALLSSVGIIYYMI